MREPAAWGSAGSRRPARLLRRVAHPARVDFRCAGARWSRCWAATAPEDHHPQGDHGHLSRAPAGYSKGTTSSVCPQPHRPAGIRLLPRRARHLHQPFGHGKPAAAAVVRPGGMALEEIYQLFQPRSARRQPGHEALGRRTADAGHRPHPAHRRFPAAARRADRGPGAGDRPADRRHHPRLKQRGYTVVLVEQNFRFAATVADRHYVVEDGRVVDTIPNDQLAAAPKSCSGSSACNLNRQERSENMKKCQSDLVLVAALLLATAVMRQISRQCGQDRRAQRPVRRLLRPGRPGLGRGRQDGRGGLRRQGAGQAIEIIYADHQNKPDIGANIARKWFDVDKVDMIIDLPTTSVCLAVQEICKKKKRITSSPPARRPS